MQWRSNALEAQYPHVPVAKQANLFPLYGSDDLDLTLYWHSTTTGQEGHHYIIGMQLTNLEANAQ
ncbi:hypothetical protein DM01DRAFT_1340631 [Hesseltinella vesiculosa]|uniref:Uncharacterized protein n=1 Tax=Hesseltinella vesiculosa TaxID=101127 RepID=A0A1X2G3K6_9FUNG|nr:hypothetical protein DM01DRAFT_1340631 [Hesseltinella vesiculosa]